MHVNVLCSINIQNENRSGMVWNIHSLILADKICYAAAAEQVQSFIQLGQNNK